MSTADGLTDFGAGIDGGDRHVLLKNALGVRTMTGNESWDLTFANRQKLDPDGARDITMAAEAVSDGSWFEIINVASGAEDLTIKDDGGGTIITVSQNESAKVYCDGVTWNHTGIHSIAAS